MTLTNTFSQMSNATLIWQPVFSPTLTLGFGAALGLLAVIAYARSYSDSTPRAAIFLAMRLASIGAMTTLLMGPSTLPDAIPAPSPPPLYLMLDTSGSMSTIDVANQSRLDFLLEHWLNPTLIAELREAFDLRLIAIHQTATPLPLKRLTENPPSLIAGTSTRYRDALQNLLTPLPQTTTSPSSILLLGDGHETDNLPLTSVGYLAKSRGVKIHTVSVGSTQPPPDLALIAIPQQPYLLPDETGSMLIQVHQSGFADAAASIQIQTSDGQTIHKTIAFNNQPSASITLPVTHASPGRYAYQISAATLPGETSTANNTHTAFVEVTQQPMRVLILEGEPYWDTKFLAQALRTDNRIQLDHIAQINPKKRQNIVTRSAGDQQTSLSVPTSADDLNVYDAIILGRGIEHLLDITTLKKLEAYVSNTGGSLIFARGLAYDPNTAEGQIASVALEPLEPVHFGLGVMNHIQLNLTNPGLSNPAFAFQNLGDTSQGVVTNLPPIDSLHVVDSLKPATIVLAQAATTNGQIDNNPSSTPAIVTMAYGRGRVFAILGEGLWRWSFLPPEKIKLRGAFQSFWSNTLRWMVMGGAFQPGQEVSLQLGRSSLRAGDTQSIDLTTKSPPAAPPTLSVTNPAGIEQQLQFRKIPGGQTSYRASFNPDQPGVWSVNVQTPGLEPSQLTQPFSVYDLDLERLNAAARPQTLKQLADQTGGLFFEASQPVNLAHQLQRLRASMLVPPKPVYMWDEAWILTCLLLWMGLEWLGRRKAGWL